MGVDPMYDLQTFDHPGSTVALGHIHKHQALSFAATGGVRRQYRPRRFRRAERGQGWCASRSPKRARRVGVSKSLGSAFLTIEQLSTRTTRPKTVVRGYRAPGDKLEYAVVRVRIDVPPERIAELNDDDIALS